MADVNDAYRVLRDPIRRARYDADLRRRSAATATGSAGPRAAGTAGPGHPTGSSPPIDRTPARYQWKLVGGMAALGVGVVLAGAAFYEPAGPARPDNVLEPGSCVSIELNQDVREVNCDGIDDLVVRALVPSDERCRQGLSAYRDRQGMGLACVSPDTTP